MPDDRPRTCLRSYVSRLPTGHWEFRVYNGATLIAYGVRSTKIAAEAALEDVARRELGGEDA